MAAFFQANPGWAQAAPRWMQTADIVSDTDVLTKPVDAVLAKAIRMKKDRWEFERLPGRGGVKVTGKASGVTQIKGDGLSFSEGTIKRIFGEG